MNQAEMSQAETNPAEMTHEGFFLQPDWGFRLNWLKKKGEKNVGGKHHYPHSTLVMQGTVRMTTYIEVPLTLSEREAIEAKNIADNAADPTIILLPAPSYRLEQESEGEFGGWSILHIAAEKHHQFEALTDKCGWICAFVSRDFEGMPIRNYIGNINAYN